MKRLLFATVALAVSATTTMAQGSANWSGVYLGVHAGLGWVKSDTTAVTGSNTFPTGFNFTQNHPDGFLGGAQLGYNYQSGAWVLGLEGEVSGSSITGRDVSNSPLIGGRFTTAEGSLSWMTAATAKLGYAAGNWLVYAKAGWAWAHFGGEAATSTAGGTVVAIAKGGEIRDGYLLGLGAEYRISRNWSAKLEYNFVDYGSDRIDRLTISGTTAGTNLVRDATAEMHAVKFGINYRF